jgi:hypothetical protein
VGDWVAILWRTIQSARASILDIFSTQDLGNELKTKVNEVTQANDFKLKQVQKDLDEKKKVSKLF